ncbi:prolipoprotein diacylglyceryl transferase [Marinoscillum pacificum]|uniref:prolipoprotein diacylglyceryl transferase n=1 Tax=Marinoscillum pacificum TaxID=392723 RepID=UPI0021584655|nr:prolipoprotein diacylglyceryl transferase [Marinoscillum pacificum]
MEFILNFLIWSPDPNIFVIPGIDHPVRWYGLLFAGGFILSQQVMFWVFRSENRPEKDVEKLTVYMVIAVIVGARLGHCLFYNPGYYLSNPVEIFKVWEGGLASHGGAIGMIVAIYIFSKRYPQYPMLWMLDRLVIVAALTGAMIRTGNFFNSEMEGTMTNSNMGVVYARYTEDLLRYDDRKVDDVTFLKGGDMQSSEPGLHPITAKITYNRGVQLGAEDKDFFENNLRSALLRYTEVVQHIDFGKDQPLAYKFYEEDGRAVAEIYGLGISRHVAQLYEAFYCLILMALTMWIWKVKRFKLPQGFNFAVFMIILWSARFMDEFFKMNQEAFEENLVLNMGQILSIPAALSGVVMLILFLNSGKKTMSGDPR